MSPVYIPERTDGVPIPTGVGPADEYTQRIAIAVDQLGEVSASPTANTLLARLKAVTDALVDLLTELEAKADLGETQLVSIESMSPSDASGQVSTLGNNTLLTPASGKKLRLFYVSYNPIVAVEAAFRFGAAGGLFLRNNVTAGSVIAKDYGFSRYKEGAVDEPLVLNLSVGVAVNWNAFYQEV